MNTKWKYALAAIVFGVAVALLTWRGLDAFFPGLFRENGIYFVIAFTIIIPFGLGAAVGAARDTSIDERPIKLCLLAIWAALITYSSIYLLGGYHLLPDEPRCAMCFLLFLASLLVGVIGFGLGFLLRLGWLESVNALAGARSRLRLTSSRRSRRRWLPVFHHKHLH